MLCKLFLALHMFQAMEAAIQAGEVVKTTTDDGEEFFTFRKLTSGVERGSEGSLSLTRQKTIKGAVAGQLDELFDQLNWSFDSKKVDAGKIVPGKKIPDAMTKVLEQAASAQVRLCGDNTKMLSKSLGLVEVQSILALVESTFPDKVLSINIQNNYPRILLKSSGDKSLDKYSAVTILKIAHK